MALRDRLFEQVWFTSKMSPQNQKVGAAIGTAFYQMPFTRIYELLARAAVCNFGDSWSDIASLLGMADVQDSSPQDSANVEPFFAHPMDAGMCTVADLRARDSDGEPVLDIADVADMNERLIVQAENRKRAEDAAKRKSDASSKGPRRRP